MSKTIVKRVLISLLIGMAVGAALSEHKEYICTETQADSLDQNGTSGEAVETEDFTLLLDIELVS